MSWPKHHREHSLARRKISTRKERHDKRLKKPWIVTWKQEDKDGKVIEVSQEFKDEESAVKHIKSLVASAKSFNRPVKILSIEEVN